jgi:membrane-associated phospholipid phosphatase
MWAAISDLGDAALTLPLAVVCFIWLTRTLTGARVAIAWGALLAGAMLLVGVTKILYAGCGVEIRAIDFRVISGHTMLASAIWPMSCLLALRNDRAIGSSAALSPGIVIAGLIGISRVFDDAHTISEVIAGWALGLLVTVLLLRWHSVPTLPAKLRPLAAGSLLTVSAVAYGHHAPIQTAIERYSPFFCSRPARAQAGISSIESDRSSLLAH